MAVICKKCARRFYTYTVCTDCGTRFTKQITRKRDFINKLKNL